MQNYPNKFYPAVFIKYDLPRDVRFLIKVYGIIGKEIKNLVDENEQAGCHQVIFDGTNLASGDCFYRIEAASFVSSRKNGLSEISPSVAFSYRFALILNRLNHNFVQFLYALYMF